MQRADACDKLAITASYKLRLIDADSSANVNCNVCNVQRLQQFFLICDANNLKIPAGSYSM